MRAPLLPYCYGVASPGTVCRYANQGCSGPAPVHREAPSRKRALVPAEGALRGLGGAGFAGGAPGSYGYGGGGYGGSALANHRRALKQIQVVNDHRRATAAVSPL